MIRSAIRSIAYRAIDRIRSWRRRDIPVFVEDPLSTEEVDLAHQMIRGVELVVDVEEVADSRCDEPRLVHETIAESRAGFAFPLGDSDGAWNPSWAHGGPRSCFTCEPRPSASWHYVIGDVRIDTGLSGVVGLDATYLSAIALRIGRPYEDMVAELYGEPLDVDAVLTGAWFRVFAELDTEWDESDEGLSCYGRGPGAAELEAAIREATEALTARAHEDGPDWIAQREVLRDLRITSLRALSDHRRLAVFQERTDPALFKAELARGAADEDASPLAPDVKALEEAVRQARDLLANLPENEDARWDAMGSAISQILSLSGPHIHLRAQEIMVGGGALVEILGLFAPDSTDSLEDAQPEEPASEPEPEPIPVRPPGWPLTRVTTKPRVIS